MTHNKTTISTNIDMEGKTLLMVDAVKVDVVEALLMVDKPVLMEDDDVVVIDDSVFAEVVLETLVVVIEVVLVVLDDILVVVVSGNGHVRSVTLPQIKLLFEQNPGRTPQKKLFEISRFST